MEQETIFHRPWVVVRGAGDLATGTILRLHRCGFRVLVTECEDPSAIRRMAALCPAVWNGASQVEGVRCRRVTDIAQGRQVSDRGEIPLLVDPDCRCVSGVKPAAVVDAILAKKNLGTSRSMAPITVALGPGFSAGEDVDCVIETMRGHHLGRVIRQGYAIADTGVPGNIGGYTHQRVIHAPDSGSMSFVKDSDGRTIDIGSLVTQGQVIGLVGDTPVFASISGVLRGLIREGYPVTKGMKIADIDPRPEQAAFCDTVSDKASAIAGGVLEALLCEGRKKSIRFI